MNLITKQTRNSRRILSRSGGFHITRGKEVKKKKAEEEEEGLIDFAFHAKR